MKSINKKTRPFLFAGMVLTLFALLYGCNSKDKFEAYKVLDSRFISEVNAECVLLEHTQSGAKVFKIKADDPNKLFAIAFKTVPDSDCGTPHIIEHSVLNGSKNFPVKSPFDVLSQGSLNTFLNAMTGSDLTIYPVASMNDKDYYNLMHVYLDAVFNPLMYSDERIFKQEGWHYELTGNDDPLIYKGVVYNEMKGAYSSPTRELSYQVYKNLFPDNSYRFSSGGYPSAIPELTYEAFLAFHKKHYHPSNSYILLYGDADLAEELSFIDANYLSEYEVSDEFINIDEQLPFDEMKRVVASYPVLEGSPTNNQSFLRLSFVVGHNTDQAKGMAYNVLTDVLVNQESAPLRKALQEAGIGSDVSAFLDGNMQTAMHIDVRNANEDQLDEFYEITMKVLQKAVEDGLDKKAMEGTINRMEFNLREGDSPQKGLTYGMQLLSGWFFAGDPFMGLEFEAPLAEAKRALTEDYLEEMIKVDLISNNHCLLFALIPEPGLQSILDKKISDGMVKKKQALEAETKALLINETKELIEYQKRADSPEALATIPLLSLDDITKDVVWYEAEGKVVDDNTVIHLDEFTNNIIYSKLLFDIRALPIEKAQYVALLSELMGLFDTEEYSYGELDNAININTGGFNTYTNSYLTDMNDDLVVPKLIIEAKTINDKSEILFDLINEIVNTDYSNKDRLKTLLIRHFAGLDANVKNNGINVAAIRLFSYYSSGGVYNEMMSGLEYYWFIGALVNNFDEMADEIISNLNEVSETIFTKSNLMANVTCNSADYKTYTASLNNFTASLSEGTDDLNEWELLPVKKNEGFITTSKVQYVLKGANIKDLGYEWSGKIKVLSQIISTDWLQNQIRVIGGAYGGFSNFGTSGNMFFGSYRDPNLSESLDNYDATTGYLENFEASEDAMTRYIIGTIAGMDFPETPSMKGNTALTRYFNGTTREFMQNQRDDVLSTTSDDISAMKDMVKDLMEQDIYCVYGNKEKIEMNKGLFMTILNPLK